MNQKSNQFVAPNLEATSDGEENIYVATVARKISQVYKEKVRNRHRRINTRSQIDTVGPTKKSKYKKISDGLLAQRQYIRCQGQNTHRTKIFGLDYLTNTSY